MFEPDLGGENGTYSFGDWTVGLQEVTDHLPHLRKGQRINVTQLGALIADGFYTERTSRAGDQRDRILNVTNDAWVVLWKEVPESIAVKVEPWLCQMEKQGEERSEMIGDILEALAALYFTSREYLHLQALVSAVAKLMWPSPEASFSAAVAWRPGSYKGGSPGWCAKAEKTIEIYSIRIHFFDSHSLSTSHPCQIVLVRHSVTGSLSFLYIFVGFFGSLN